MSPPLRVNYVVVAQFGAPSREEVHRFGIGELLFSTLRDATLHQAVS